MRPQRLEINRIAVKITHVPKGLKRRYAASRATGSGEFGIGGRRFALCEGACFGSLLGLDLLLLLAGAAVFSDAGLFSLAQFTASLLLAAPLSGLGFRLRAVLFVPF